MAARLVSLTEPARSIGEELAGWGKVALIDTIGRISGMPVRNAVGFIEAGDGALIVAAGSESADWVLNLRSNGTCRATIGDHTGTYRAAEIEATDRAAALVQLILKYGTPAERLGHGPVFRLQPLSEQTP